MSGRRLGLYLSLRDGPECVEFVNVFLTGLATVQMVGCVSGESRGSGGDPPGMALTLSVSSHEEEPKCFIAERSAGAVRCCGYEGCAGAEFRGEISGWAAVDGCLDKNALLLAGEAEECLTDKGGVAGDLDSVAECVVVVGKQRFLRRVVGV